ncbi:MAG: 3-oxoacyl-ACP reductase FabG [Acidobacteria bacterium]|nr:3-oxoacyl-ACP reductase FabG [Acidobacteriota bacterium]
MRLGVESLSLRGRVAMVTGGSRGIGRAVVLRLAECGAHVVTTFLRDEGGADEVVRAARGYGVEAISARGDVSRVEDARAVVRLAGEKFGRLDVLVCSAGVWEGAPIESHAEGLWDRVLDVNLKGTWALCHAAAGLLCEGGWGRVVVVSSTAGQRGEANYSGYAASKGGQIAFVKSLAAELAPRGVTVNAVAPGWVDTEMTADVLRVESSRREIESAIPLGRVATPDDVALPVVFLCSEWARHITGEVLNVNGGSVLCG